MVRPDGWAHRFDVWAPHAQRVDLVLGSETLGSETAGSETLGSETLDTETTPMRRSGNDDGWWVAADDIATRLDDTVRYGYRVDDKGPLPDPRSRRQPDGVHEFSGTFDTRSFPWNDSSWRGRQLAGGLIYELHIGTFTPEGTLDAAIGRLDHLVSLGVDFVEVLPVNAFNGPHNWGYDGVLWYAVQETYGGPRAYQHFVDACHVAGLGVIQDVVYNHLGPSGNYLGEFGPYVRADASNTWGGAINLDGPGSDEVRRYILDNALMWLGDYHVDGLRLDAVHALVDTRALTLLEELAIEVAALSAHLGRPLTLIAESDLNDPKLITSREANGYGLDAQWSDDFHHAVHVNLTGEVSGYYADFDGLSSLAKVLTAGFFHDGTLSTFRGRHHGRSIDTMRMPTSRLVVFDQDHDQVGNRATGDRLAATLDDERLAIAAALTLLGPFTPMLFMGEEWAASTPWQFFTSHPEPELGRATADGRIAEFARMGWDPSSVPNPQDPETFQRSKLDWDELGVGRHAALLDFYRTLGRLRRELPEVTDPRFGSTRVEYNADARWLALHRGEVTVAFSLADGDAQADVPLSAAMQLVTAFGTVELTADALHFRGAGLAVCVSSRG